VYIPTITATCRGIETIQDIQGAISPIVMHHHSDGTLTASPVSETIVALPSSSEIHMPRTPTDRRPVVPPLLLRETVTTRTIDMALEATFVNAESTRRRTTIVIREPPAERWSLSDQKDHLAQNQSRDQGFCDDSPVWIRSTDALTEDMMTPTITTAQALLREPLVDTMMSEFKIQTSMVMMASGSIEKENGSQNGAEAEVGPGLTLEIVLRLLNQSERRNPTPDEARPGCQGDWFIPKYCTI
jgi:hypothetical protein